MRRPATCNFDATGYRLPTEAEWEYACRAGASADDSFGSDGAGLNELRLVRREFREEDASRSARSDPTRGACSTCTATWPNGATMSTTRTTTKTVPTETRGPADGKLYVLRGGSWKSAASALRSTARLGDTPGFSDACLARDAIGFRCVRKAP